MEITYILTWSGVQHGPDYKTFDEAYLAALDLMEKDKENVVYKFRQYTICKKVGEQFFKIWRMA